MPKYNDKKEVKPTITIQRINTVEVKPIKIKGKDERPAKGYDMFPMPFFNTFILSKRNSGKSVLVANILKKCCRKNYSTVVIFSNTLYKDGTWITLRKWCKKNHIDFVGHTDIKYTDSNGVKHDALGDLLKRSREVGEEEVLDSDASDSEESKSSGSEEDYSEDDIPEEDQPTHFNYSIRPKKIHISYKCVSETPSAKIEYPTIAPKLFIIFDDISSDLKLPSVQELVKNSRHYLAACCFSSQAVVDVLPSCRKNANYFCLFAGLNESDLERVRVDGGLPVSIETLMKMYKEATKHRYSFLYIDCDNGQFRINFNRKFNIVTNKQDANKKSSKTHSED
jgi:hypothetical protein